MKDCKGYTLRGRPKTFSINGIKATRFNRTIQNTDIVFCKGSDGKKYYISGDIYSHDKDMFVAFWQGTISDDLFSIKKNNPDDDYRELKLN